MEYKCLIHTCRIMGDICCYSCPKIDQCPNNCDNHPTLCSCAEKIKKQSKEDKNVQSV